MRVDNFVFVYNPWYVQSSVGNDEEEQYEF